MKTQRIHTRMYPKVTFLVRTVLVLLLALILKAPDEPQLYRIHLFLGAPFFFLVLYRYYARVKQSKARINFECVFLSVRKYIQIQKSISMRSFKGFPPWRPWIECTEVRILLLLLLLRPLWLSTEDRREKGRKYIKIHSFSP